MTDALEMLYYEVMAKFQLEACASGYATVGKCPPEKVMDYIYEQSSGLYHALEYAKKEIDSRTKA